MQQNANKCKSANERQNLRPRKSKFVTGKSTKDPSMSGVKRPPTADVFVTRMPAKCTVEEIKSFIFTNTQIEVKVTKIETKHDNIFSSLHVSGICENPDVLLHSMLWPENSLFRKWYPPRNKRVLIVADNADINNTS